MTQTTQFEGTCWGCGKGHFCDVCHQFPPPPEWFMEAVRHLQAEGWTFVRDDEHVPRAVCKRCKEAGSLERSIQRGWILHVEP